MIINLFVILSGGIFVFLIMWIAGLLLLESPGFGKYNSFSIISSESCENFSANILFNIAFPNILLILIIKGLSVTTSNIEYKGLFLITILYYVIRNLMIIIQGRSKTIAVKREVFTLLISGALSYFIEFNYRVDGFDLVPSLSSIRDEAWLIIIVFAAGMLYDWCYNQAYYDSDSIRKKYIISAYGHFRKKYDYIVRTELSDVYYDDYAILVYAIMIYENYNRSNIIRLCEYVVFLCYKIIPFVDNKTMSLGIMQVTTDKLIGNKRSITMAIDMIIGFIQTEGADDKEAVMHTVIRLYNNDDAYITDVEDVLDVLQYEESKNTREIYEDALLDEEILKDDIKYFFKQQNYFFLEELEGGYIAARNYFSPERIIPVLIAFHMQEGMIEKVMSERGLGICFCYSEKAVKLQELEFESGIRYFTDSDIREY